MLSGRSVGYKNWLYSTSKISIIISLKVNATIFTKHDLKILFLVIIQT